MCGTTANTQECEYTGMCSGFQQNAWHVSVIILFLVSSKFGCLFTVVISRELSFGCSLQMHFSAPFYMGVTDPEVQGASVSTSGCKPGCLVLCTSGFATEALNSSKK